MKQVSSVLVHNQFQYIIVKVLFFLANFTTSSFVIPFFEFQNILKSKAKISKPLVPITYHLSTLDYVFPDLIFEVVAFRGGLSYKSVHLLIILFKYRLNLKTIMSSVEIQEAESTEVAGFIAKTYEILNNQNFAKISYWAPSGTEFIIKDINKFQQTVLPKYFRHGKINSFIRQLNMYGFHKSRADHTKSVFSHPSFQRGRADLLITIKRKIKEKNDQKLETAIQTPIKKREEVEVNTANTKKILETGNELTSLHQCGHSYNNLSFNILGTKQKLNSIINLNCSLNVLPQGNLGQMNLDDDVEQQDDQASIADKMGLSDQKQEEKIVPSLNYKFINPSCFFQSMHGSNY